MIKDNYYYWNTMQHIDKKSLFSALIIFGLVTLSSAVQDNCHYLPVKHNFDPAAYFKDTWYLTNSLWVNHKEDPDNIGCYKIDTQALGTIAWQFCTKKFQGNIRYSENYISLDSFSQGIGHYSFINRELTEDGKPLTLFILEERTIIDTDYKSYAIVNECFDMGSDYDSQFFIYNRKQDGDLPPRVEVVLDLLGYKLSDFLSNKHLNCSWNSDGL